MHPADPPAPAPLGAPDPGLPAAIRALLPTDLPADLAPALPADLPRELRAAVTDQAALSAFLTGLPTPSDDEVVARATSLATLPSDPALRRRLLDVAISVTDLTTLEADDTPTRVRALSATAAQPDPDDPTCPPVAAVCVYPDLVAVAAKALTDTPVGVAAVAGAFPSSRSPLGIKVAEVRAAVAAGAREIDHVIDRGALAEGRTLQALTSLLAVVAASGPAKVKVILETGALETTGQMRQAAWLAFLAGADVVKTSTGKDGPGASLPATLVLTEVAVEVAARTGRLTGVKASGGIRTADDALRYLVLLAAVAGEDWWNPTRFRFGASSLLAALVAARRAAAD